MATLSVSVIVPVFNGERHVAAALDSVLAQSHPPAEITVVDDGSTDDTVGVVRRYGNRVRLVCEPNRGPGAARNLGAAGASSAWIAFLDADDVWRPQALESHLTALRGAPDAALAWGQSELVIAPGTQATGEEWESRPQWFLSVSSMLFHRGMLEALGGFDPAVRYGEDFDLLVRLHETGRFMLRHATVVAERRLHSQNLTRDDAEMRRQHFRVIQRAFDRRRALGRTGPGR